MTEVYPNLVYSDLGGDFHLEGITVKVIIVQLEGSSAIAFFCPTRITNFFPRVTPVYNKFLCSMV